MGLVFYYAPWCSAVTCHWALEELGVPYEKVKLNLAEKDTHKPAFLALNPNAKVPLLVHDGVPIFESIAILAHLGETFGVERNLFPAPGLLRAQALQWLAWANVSLGSAVRRYLDNTSEQIPAELRNPKAAAVHEKDVLALLGILDHHLAGRKWMVGDEFGLADVHLAGAIGWIRRLGFDVERFANITAWLAKACARPAFATVMAS
ncbi:glutathione S-transferase family protein [Labilithrix luteola]|nr:glutathione S-transferase family protein [Labilithrix luteola]